MIEQKKECLHYWQWGWLGDSLIFCIKCNKDAEDVYNKKDFNYYNHDCNDGKIIIKQKDNE